MDRESAQKLFTAYGRPQFKVGDTVISFSRQTEEDIEQIENYTNEEIIEHWKSLVWLNEIYGQVSINDLQRISLLELEMQERGDINQEDLEVWCNEQENIFDGADFHDLIKTE